MAEIRGYLLPEGNAYTDDLECMILFYPNKDEYRQALFGSLDYLATWIAWERDSEKRGKDAARAWAEAVELTRECIEMGTCDLLVELLTQIELNTRTCCSESNYVTYQENTVVTTVIIPGSGSPPAYYGETAVIDWDDWLEYVCYHAHKYVDDLVGTAETLHTAVAAGGYLLDFIAHLFSLVQWRMVEDLIPVNFSVIQAIFNALGQGGIQNEFADLADDFETYRADIVCALINGTSLEEAVQDVVGDGLLWTIFYQWFDYETTTAVIYEGEVPDVGYLPPVQRDDCDCQTITEGDIYGVCFRVTEYNSEHSNGTLSVAKNDVSSASLVYGGQYANRDSFGGTQTAYTDLPTPKTVAAGNAAALAAIAADYEVTPTGHNAAESGISGFTMQNNNLSGLRWVQIQFDTPKVFVSDDAGATGVWVDADMVFSSAPSGTTYTVTDNVATFWYDSPNGGSSFRVELTKAG